MHAFRFLLTESKGKFAEETVRLEETHEIVEFVDCFASIGLQYQSVFPVKIKTKSCIVIMEKIRLDDEEEVEETTITSTMGNRRKKRNKRTAQIVVEQPARPIVENTSTDINSIYDEFSDDISVELELDEDQFVEEELAVDKQHASATNKPQKELKRTKFKIKALIEAHYRAKGRIIEADVGSGEDIVEKVTPIMSTKTNIKQIIRAEKIKELVEKISHLDLKIVCDLDTMSTKQCLRKLIDDYDDDDDEDDDAVAVTIAH